MLPSSMKHITTILVSVIRIIPCVLFTCTAPVSSMRILAIEPIGGRSHWNFMGSVLRVLSENGHNVTVFTPFLDGDMVNYTEVDISDVLPVKTNLDASEMFENWCKSTVFIPLIMNITRYNCHVVYENDRMKDMLRGDTATGTNYDIVIGEVASSACISYAAATLDLPLIYVIPSPMITYIEYDLFGHISNPAVVSNLVSDYAVPKTFGQRLKNVAYLVYTVVSTKYREWTMTMNDPQPFDSTKPVAPSLVFINTHYVTEASNPLPLNVVQVGGIHLRRAASTPDDILEFIENSPNGVIYFTFGSVVKMSTLPDNIKNAFKEALSRMPQRVLWKYEGEMKDVPKNVMIKKWFPQREILLHPNVKLFISHGGISGVYETVDAGVPVLGFPLFYDQHKNIANLVDAGMAISMDLLSVSADTLLSSMSELINNKNYSINAKITRERFKDRPMSPEQSVVYWTEYVHRHKGAPHLKSHALNLSWYQYFLLDVFVAILVCICIALFVGYTIVKVIYKYTLVHSKNVKMKSE